MTDDPNGGPPSSRAEQSILRRLEALEHQRDEAQSDLDRLRKIDGRDKVWLSPADVLRRQRDITQRYPTGLPTLDKLLAGGIPRGRMMLVVGRPGSGKTGLGLQIAARSAEINPDMLVGLYMADEGLEAAVIRLAQRYGHSRETLEAASKDTITAASQELERLGNIFCLDPDDPGSCIESFCGGMAERAGTDRDRTELWVIDSAQVVRAQNRQHPDVRLGVKAVADDVKRLARKRGAVAILLSQSNRAAYRSKDAKENADPLSAGAESAALEHMADVLVFLAPYGKDVETETAERVQLQVPKNRVGRVRLKPVIIQWNRECATFVELDAKALEIAEEAEAMIDVSKQVQLAADKLRKALLKNPEGLSTNQLRDAANLSGKDTRRARDAMERNGTIFSEPNAKRGGGMVWKLSSAGLTAAYVPPQKEEPAPPPEAEVVVLQPVEHLPGPWLPLEPEAELQPRTIQPPPPAKPVQTSWMQTPLKT